MGVDHWRACWVCRNLVFSTSVVARGLTETNKIDNLGKGAYGQALQNLNEMMGLPGIFFNELDGVGGDKERLDILKVLSRKLPLASEVDLDATAQDVICLIIISSSSSSAFRCTVASGEGSTWEEASYNGLSSEVRSIKGKPIDLRCREEKTP
ncbi:hypothetical protein NL676_009081 [Syzygium grande]|nr:hypothetical protein NL676_009081 [Syzygium grande]